MGEKHEDLKTLDNFDKEGRSQPLINSPRSLEACRRSGFKPQELVVVSKEQAMEMYKARKMTSPQMFDLFCKHLEERRQQKLEAAQKTRKDVIKEESDGLWSADGSASFNKSTNRGKSLKNEPIGMIEHEKKILEKIQYRQQKEVQKMVEYEIKMEEMRQKKLDKERKQQEKQERFEHEVDNRRKDAEEKRRKQNEEKHRKQLEEEAKNKKIINEMFKKEQDRIKKEMIKEREHRKVIVQKEEEKKRKQEEYQMQTQKLLEGQQKQVQEKKKKMDDQEIHRQVKFAEQNDERRRVAREIQEYHHKKIEMAKVKNDQIIENQRKEFYRKQELLEKRREELEKQHKEHELLKQQEEKERNLKLQGVRENNEVLLHEKIQGYVEILNKTDAKVEKAKDRLKQELVEKRDFEIMKSMDREDNRQRIMQMQDFKRQLLKQRIDRDNEKTRYIREEQHNNILKRHNLRREMNDKREKMIEDFYKNQKKMAKSAAHGFSKTDGDGRSEGNHAQSGNVSTRNA